MARLPRPKRNEIGRKRDRHRPLPQGMSIRELAAKTGVTVRTVRHYLDERLVPRPEFRGTATRYGREHLVRVLFIDKLRRERRMKLAAIRQQMDQLTLA